MSAEQGISEARVKLAGCYFTGDGVEKNYEEAIKWYRCSVKQGGHVAENAIGLCYYQGGYGIDKDESEAVKWFSKAAENNVPNAQYNLGICYEYGRGVEKDFNIAFQWYKKAADNVNPDKDACFKMAEAYYKQIDSNEIKRLGGLLAVSVLIPVTNWVTIPASYFGNEIAKRRKTKEFLKTDAGEDMLKYYNKAADLGHEKARRRLKDLKVI